MFCAPKLIFGGTEGVATRFTLPDSFPEVSTTSGPVFMFYAPGLVFGGNEGIDSCFHFLSSRSPFPRYRGRQVPFSYFSLPDSFSVGNDRVSSRFHVLRS
jgi:hypothetical protein